MKPVFDTIRVQLQYLEANFLYAGGMNMPLVWVLWHFETLSNHSHLIAELTTNQILN